MIWLDCRIEALIRLLTDVLKLVQRSCWWRHRRWIGLLCIQRLSVHAERRNHHFESGRLWYTLWSCIWVHQLVNLVLIQRLRRRFQIVSCLFSLNLNFRLCLHLQHLLHLLYFLQLPQLPDLFLIVLRIKIQVIKSMGSHFVKNLGRLIILWTDTNF